jgi:hypothetical protein
MNNRFSSLTPTRKTLSIISLAALLTLLPLAAMSAETADTSGGDTPSSTTLQGNVVEAAVTLNNLRDARLSISRVRKAAANLYDEVTREQMSMGFNPNVVGSTVIMTPVPQRTGLILPARKKWVDASMAEISPIINLFKEDVDVALETNRRSDVREKAQESLTPIRTTAFEQVKKSFDIYKQLSTLTSGNNPIDQPAIAARVKELDSTMKELDKSLKRGISILQKETRAQKKSKSA